MFAMGISFTANSACGFDPYSNCLICSFQSVPNEPGACRGDGIGCITALCDSPKQ
jgi:hypothetical protein